MVEFINQIKNTWSFSLLTLILFLTMLNSILQKLLNCELSNELESQAVWSRLSHKSLFQPNKMVNIYYKTNVCTFSIMFLTQNINCFFTLILNNCCLHNNWKLFNWVRREVWNPRVMWIGFNKSTSLYVLWISTKH